MIVGIDYSIRSPAITVCKGDWYWCYFRSPIRREIVQHNFCLRGVVDVPFTGTKRYAQLADWAQIVVGYGVENRDDKFIVGFEGSSYGSPGRVIQLAENVGAAKYALSQLNCDIYDIAPQSIKKFATGSGRAEKIDMYNAFVAKTKVNLAQFFDTGPEGNPLSDIIDSYWITQYIIHNKESLTGGLDAQTKKKKKRRRKKAKFSYDQSRSSS